jgi:hypothetical protein
VVLKAYVQWGLDCLLKFNGMWAFGLWDESSKQLIIARDRYGIKPVLFFKNGNRLAFASEYKAFLHLKDCDIIISENPTKSGLLQGIEEVPPGHLLIVKKKSVELHRWWRPRDHWPSIPSDYETQVEQFRNLFLDSCRIRMRSDVPLATSISGGVDSVQYYAPLPGSIDIARRLICNAAQVTGKGLFTLAGPTLHRMNDVTLKSQWLLPALSQFGTTVWPMRHWTSLLF